MSDKGPKSICNPYALQLEVRKARDCYPSLDSAQLRLLVLNSSLHGGKCFMNFVIC